MIGDGKLWKYSSTTSSVLQSDKKPGRRNCDEKN